MQYERDHREEQQQVDQPSGDVKYSESAEPSDQQHHENNCPDAHLYSPLLQGAEHNNKDASGAGRILLPPGLPV